MVIVIINILYVVDAKNRYNQASGGEYFNFRFFRIQILTQNFITQNLVITFSVITVFLIEGAMTVNKGPADDEISDQMVFKMILSLRACPVKTHLQAVFLQLKVSSWKYFPVSRGSTSASTERW